MVQLDKHALRQSAHELRNQLKQIEPDAPAMVRDKFPEKLLQRFGPTVSGYLSIGSELDISPLLNRLSELGAEICYPRVEADDTMTFRVVTRPADFEAGPFGLTQPSDHTPLANPTLVLAPLLAFDAAGNRLGYGKGHYDRALAKLKAEGRVFVCGIAFSGQEVLKVPAEATDIPLDWVVTENGSIPLFFARAGGR